MKKLLCTILTAMLTLALFAGCAASRDNTTAEYAVSEETEWSDEYYGNSYDSSYDSSYEAPQEQPAAETSGLGVKDAASLSTPDYGGRKVIRTISISLETDTFDDNVNALLDRASELGGYVEYSEISGSAPKVYNDPGRSGSFTFRIPVGKVDEFAADAKGLATLKFCNENAEDITSQYFDTETRLSVLRTQLERLTSILVQTDNLADIIELENEIARVTLEIEELTTELRRYDGLVDYATVSVELQELRLTQGPVTEKTVGERMAEDFRDSLYGVGEFIVNAVVWFIGALPVLVFIGAIGTGLFFLIRGGKKRRERRRAKRAAKLQKKADRLTGKLNTTAQPQNEVQTGEDKVQTEEDKND